MKKKIKVLHLIASLENGGAERQLIELLKKNKNHGVVLFKNASVYKNTLNMLNIKYWELEKLTDLYLLSSLKHGKWVALLKKYNVPVNLKIK